MPNERFPRWQKRLLLFAALGLALTGMGQMPIFSRYYIADLPGLGWLGDYETTAALHLALAAVLLFVLGMFVAGWFGKGAGRPRLTAAGWQRVVLYGALAATGLMRVLQNGALPLVGPLSVRYLDWTHLGLAMGLLVFAMSQGKKECLRRPKG